MVFSRLAASSIINMIPLTAAIMLASILHGLELRISAMPPVYLASMMAAMGVSGLALLITGPLRSTHQISVIVSVLGVTLTNLSPLLFPFGVLPDWAKAALIVNPLTGAIVITRSALLGVDINALMIPLMITISIIWLIAGIIIIIYKIKKI